MGGARALEWAVSHPDNVRSALVLAVGVSDDDASLPMVRIAYGTSQGLDRLYTGEFAVTPADGAAFEAGRTERIDRGFDPAQFGIVLTSRR